MSASAQKLFYVSTHRYGFKAGEPLEIIGAAMVTPEGEDPRPCFRVRAEDGQEDYAPIFNDRHLYEVITEEDVRAGRIPAITT